MGNIVDNRAGFFCFAADVAHWLSGLVALAGLHATLCASPTDPALDVYPIVENPGAQYANNVRRFQGIPGIARAPSGRLWATWYSGGLGEGPENYVVLATSIDNGNSWSDIRYIIDPPGVVRAFDPALWVDPQGRLWWFYAQSHGISTWDGRAGVWACTTATPDSPTPTWSSPRRICDGIMMNKPTVLKNGTWLFPIAIWSWAPTAATGVSEQMKSYVHWDPALAGAGVYRSRDNGATFERLGTAKVENVDAHEHMLVERNNGDLWMLVRTRTGIAECSSADGGLTWSEPKVSSIPHVGSRFFIRRLLSGHLLLVKNNPRMDSAWLAGLSGLYARQRRSHLTAYVSDDDGTTWRGGLLLDERLAVSYPDGVEAPDGTFYVISDYDRYKTKEIILSRFTERDVLAKRLATPSSALHLVVNRATGPDVR